MFKPYYDTPANPVLIIDPVTGVPITYPLQTTNPSPSVSSGWNTVSVSNSILVSNSSTQLIPANPNRKYIYIANNSTSMIYLQLGGSAIYGKGIRLSSGGLFTMSGSELFLGVINAISQTDNLIDVLEGV